jgi:hypothetical protein
LISREHYKRACLDGLDAFAGCEISQFLIFGAGIKNDPLGL